MKKIGKVKPAEGLKTLSEMSDTDFETLVTDSFVEEVVDRSGFEPVDVDEEFEFWRTPTE